MSYTFSVTCNGPDDGEGYIGYKECDKWLDEMVTVLSRSGLEITDSFWEVER